MQCTKNKPYELLKTENWLAARVSFSAISPVWKVSNLQLYRCENLLQNSRVRCELCCSGQEMPCGKEQHVEVDQRYDTEELCNQAMKGTLFGFLQVDIHVPDELTDKFSEFCLLFVVDSVPDESIPSSMREYQINKETPWSYACQQDLTFPCIL